MKMKVRDIRLITFQGTNSKLNIFQLYLEQDGTYIFCGILGGTIIGTMQTCIDR